MATIFETYLVHETALKRYLRRYCSSPQDVEDIAQEAFLKAFAADAVRPVLFPKAFLFRVARNLALNLQEKKSNRQTESLEDLGESAVIDSGTVGGDAEVESRECLRLLMQAVSTLPPQCARAFLLRKIDGYSYQQIAEKMGISVSTAEKHVALGLLRCSDYLRKQGYDVGARRSGHMTGRADGPAAVPRGMVFPVVRIENRGKD